MKYSRIIPICAVAALAASSAVITPAFATAGSGFAPNPVVNGHFGQLQVNTPGNKTGKWSLFLKTLDETDIGVDRLAIQGGGYSGWHAHPSPVFVTVTQGSVTWYDGSKPGCPGRTYQAGESFIEGAYVPHDVRNASNSDSAEYIAVVIKPAGFIGPAFRLDRPLPSSCTF